MNLAKRIKKTNHNLALEPATTSVILQHKHPPTKVIQFIFHYKNLQNEVR